MEHPTQLSEGLRIRAATLEDAGEVVRLIQQLASDSEEQSPVTEAYVLSYLEGTNRQILLAEHQGRIRGLLSYSVRPDLYHAGNSILIEELVVDKDCRGHGIGSALLRSLMDRAEDWDPREICLAVMPDNERAIRFYRSHGLVEETLFLERHFPT